MRTISSTGLSPSPATATVEGQRSPWHSPVPYLFGGLAAMLGLIAFALLILACSYWRLNGQNNNDGERDDNRDLENGSGDGEKDSVKGVKVYEEKFLVIMAGDEKPSFLATPVFAKVSIFNEEKTDKMEEKENSDEKVKQDDHHQALDDHHDDDDDDEENREEE